MRTYRRTTGIVALVLALVGIGFALGGGSLRSSAAETPKDGAGLQYEKLGF